jgi:hypothetical protein
MIFFITNAEAGAGYGYGEWESGRVGEWESGRVGEWERGRVGEWESEWVELENDRLLFKFYVL